VSKDEKKEERMRLRDLDSRIDSGELRTVFLFFVVAAILSAQSAVIQPHFRLSYDHALEMNDRKRKRKGKKENEQYDDEQEETYEEEHNKMCKEDEHTHAKKLKYKKKTTKYINKNALLAASTRSSSSVRMLLPLVGMEPLRPKNTLHGPCFPNLSCGREQVKQRVQDRAPPSSSRNRDAWIGLISAIILGYDDICLGGGLLTRCMREGISIKIHLPTKVFGTDPNQPTENACSGGRVIHIYLDASLWGPLPNNNDDVIDWFQVALEPQLQRSYVRKTCVKSFSCSTVHDRPYSFYWQPSIVRIVENEVLINDISSFSKLVHVTLSSHDRNPNSYFTSLRIPNSVTTLGLDDWFQPTLQYFNFPPFLETFYIEDEFHASLQDVVWSDTLCTIDFRSSYGYLCRWKNHNVMTGVILPSHLHTLKLSIHCHFRGVQLPLSLRVFYFTGDDLDLTSLADLALPDDLIDLKLKFLYGAQPACFPLALTKLSLVRGAESSQGYVLPPALTQLVLCTKDEHYSVAHAACKFLRLATLPLSLRLIELQFCNAQKRFSKVLDAVQKKYPHVKIDTPGESDDDSDEEIYEE